MEETEHDRLNELSEIIFYEMPKLEQFVQGYYKGKKLIESLPAETKWCIFFKYKNDERAEKLIEELCLKEEGIMYADRALKKISRDEEQWARALFREKAAMDYYSGMSAAREDGHKEGLEAGLALGEAKGLALGEAKAHQKDLDAARKLKAAGVPGETIAESFGFTPEEIVNV
jgi:predicted transposase/invertase (TIGR01784 family)